MPLMQQFAKIYRIARIHVLALLGYIVLKLLYSSLRWEKNSIRDYDKWLPENNPKIGAFWHSRQLMLGLFFSARNRGRYIKRAVVLISRSNDGRIIAQIMRYVGIASVAGSSSRGGAVALKQILDELKSGSGIVITPDGPKGPARRLKPGIVKLAQQSGRPVYAMAYAAEKCWRFNSWDGMFLPKPFSRAVVMVGKAVFVPAELSSEQLGLYRLKIEAEINRVTDLVDNYEYC